MHDEFQKIVNRLKKQLTIEKARKRLQLSFVCWLFGILSVGMTAVNLFDGLYWLSGVAFLFCGLCALNIFLLTRNPDRMELPKFLFIFELFALLTFFLIYGKPEGIPVIWTMIFPSVAFLLLGKKQGTLTTALFLAVLIFLFWIPAGTDFLLVNYGKSFRLRYPFLYLTVALLSYFLELVRSIAEEELTGSRENYRKLALTDILTGLGNENAYYRLIKQIERDRDPDYAIAVMDVNGVKNTNDAYGHRYGCHLIVATGKALPNIFKECKLFHIGGDEFVAVLLGKGSGTKMAGYVADFEAQLSYEQIVFDGVALTHSVAVGFSHSEPGGTYQDTFQRADHAMYQSKRRIKKTYGIAER